MWQNDATADGQTDGQGGYYRAHIFHTFSNVNGLRAYHTCSNGRNFYYDDYRNEMCDYFHLDILNPEIIIPNLILHHFDIICWKFTVLLIMSIKLSRFKLSLRTYGLFCHLIFLSFSAKFKSVALNYFDIQYFSSVKKEK